MPEKYDGPFESQEEEDLALKRYKRVRNLAAAERAKEEEEAKKEKKKKGLPYVE